MSVEQWQTVIAALVIISTVILAALQWRVQGDQARINSELTHKINRLSVELDQSIQRLFRVRELVNKIHRILTYIDSGSALQSEQSLAGKHAMILLSRFLSYRAELQALKLVIADEQLSAAIDSIDSLQTSKHSSAKGTTRMVDFDRAVGGALVRVYQLLEIATSEQTSKR